MDAFDSLVGVVALLREGGLELAAKGVEEGERGKALLKIPRLDFRAAGNRFEGAEGDEPIGQGGGD